MKNVIGNEITITLFGESHGIAIGCVIDGLPSGFEIDMERLSFDMNLRRAVGKISTGRTEADQVKILSGVKNGKTEGTPVALLIENTNVRSHDYNAIEEMARPGHADYAAQMRYQGYQDPSGGGHFSGRLTAPLVAAGSICRQMLEQKGILIGSHIQQLHGIHDDAFSSDIEKDITALNQKTFAVLNDGIGKKMIAEIETAKDQLDSVGGVLETYVLNLPAGIGEPEFDSIESRLSQALFSIPGVKAVGFGDGFGFSDLYGSQANDAFAMQDGKVVTKTNHNGGINGGISNGMPIRFTTAIKPTPSIAQKQQTVNFIKNEETEIEIHGRHDPAIIHRARVVVDSMTAFVLADMLASHYGRQFLGE